MFRRPTKLAGTVPVSLFVANDRYVKSDRLPIDSGIVPINLFASNDSDVNFVKFEIELGIYPCSSYPRSSSRCTNRGWEGDTKLHVTPCQLSVQGFALGVKFHTAPTSYHLQFCPSVDVYRSWSASNSLPGMFWTRPPARLPVISRYVVSDCNHARSITWKLTKHICRAQKQETKLHAASREKLLLLCWVPRAIL